MFYARVVAAFSFSCNSRHCTLPVADLGSASANSTTSGYLYAFGLRRIIPVALENLRAIRDDFAHFIASQHVQRVRVDHQRRFGIADRDAQALALGMMSRIAVRGRHGFRLAGSVIPVSR